MVSESLVGSKNDGRRKQRGTASRRIEKEGEMSGEMKKNESEETGRNRDGI
jgi:hypothetical protein